MQKSHYLVYLLHINPLVLGFKYVVYLQISVLPVKQLRTPEGFEKIMLCLHCFILK